MVTVSRISGRTGLTLMVWMALLGGISPIHSQQESAGPTVRTEQGMLQGITVAAVDQFRGIPYASPPVGEGRWKLPLAPKAYPGGSRDAAAWPAPCMQNNAPDGLPPPSEDCLYLNVYRPARRSSQSPMPVLVYVHGGGFAGGSGSARDGAPLAGAHDMVVVMINYRLGVFGWLGLSGLDAESADHTSSGNYGLADMAEALRWLQKNIAAFGGDRNNVTLAGTSAGGIGVCALMTSPGGERLFHRAIIESGECTNTSGYMVGHQAALLQGATFAAKAGCSSAPAFVPCLRSKTAAAVQAASAGTGAFTANIGGHLMPRAPIEAIASGAAIRIPVMVGANHDEQRRNPLSITGFPATRATYEKYLTTTFGPLGSVIGAEYAADTFPDPAYAAGAIASDSGIPNGIGVCPMLAELGSALSKVTTTFVYELDDPHGSVAQGFPGFEAGSLHTAEVPILYAAAPAARTAEQAKMADRMKRYWATFAQSGKPTGGTLEWSQVTAGNKSTVMRFQPEGDAVVPWEQMVAEHHCAFWAQLGY